MDDWLFPVAAPTLPGLATVSEPAHIANLPLVNDLALQGWRDWFRVAGVRGVQLMETHTFSDSTDALQAAVYGLGVVLARTHIAVPYLERGELVRLPGPALKARFAYYAVHAAHRRPNAAALAFIHWLRQEATRQSTAHLA